MKTKLRLELTMQTYQNYITFDTFDTLDISQNKKQKVGYESHVSDICQKIINFKFWILDKAFVKNF